MSIPRIIHYCWLSNDPVPEDVRRYTEGWRRVLPDYQFVKWDLSRFDRASSAWVSEAFDCKKYAFAADYIRFYAVYHYGGIYLDMDVEVLKPFDELLDRPVMLAYERPDRRAIEAGCFGVERHNPFIKACLDYYEDRHFIRADGTCDMLPASIVMNDVRIEGRADLNLYSWDYFTAKSLRTGAETPGSNTFAIHHFKNSWKSDEERRITEKARRIRRMHPVAGIFPAFVYEKACKAVTAFRAGGIRELRSRVREYLKATL